MGEVKRRLRLAMCLQRTWQERGSRHREQCSEWRRASESWAELSRLQRRIHLAEELGFEHCLESLRSEIGWVLDRLDCVLSHMRAAERPVARPPGLSDWFQELQGLVDEFGAYDT